MANLYNTNSDVVVATGDIFMIPNHMFLMSPDKADFVILNNPDLLHYRELKVLWNGGKPCESEIDLLQKHYEAVDLRSYDNQPIRVVPTEYVRAYVQVRVITRSTYKFPTDTGVVVQKWEDDWSRTLPFSLQSGSKEWRWERESMPSILPLSVLTCLQIGDTIDFYINGKVARLTAYRCPNHPAPTSNGWLYI